MSTHIPSTVRHWVKGEEMSEAEYRRRFPQPLPSATIIPNLDPESLLQAVHRMTPDQKRRLREMLEQEKEA